MLEIVHRLAGEPDYHVCRDREACGLAALDGVFELGKRMSAVDAGERQVVCRLEPDFDNNRLIAVEFREKFDLVVFKTVRARADGESRNFLVLDNRFYDSLQMFKRCVRIRVWLQVGENSRVRVLVAEFRNKLFELFLDGDLGLVKYGTETAVVAVAASRKTLGPVKIRATHAAVEWELAHLEVVREQFQK